MKLKIQIIGQFLGFTFSEFEGNKTRSLNLMQNDEKKGLLLGAVKVSEDDKTNYEVGKTYCVECIPSVYKDNLYLRSVSSNLIK